MLDLGAAPGSWSIYAAEKVGKAGRVVAVDLQPIPTALGDNVVVVRADVLAVREPENASTSGEPADPVLVHAPYDVVMSDMAPSTSGSKVSDQARSFELFMKALDVAMHVGKSGSSFAGKIFMSGDFPKAKEAVAAHYGTCRALKPAGTRSESSEIYLVGFQLRR